jgi:hypothetical protein
MMVLQLRRHQFYKFWHRNLSLREIPSITLLGEHLRKSKSAVSDTMLRRAAADFRQLNMVGETWCLLLIKTSAPRDLVLRCIDNAPFLDSIQSMGLGDIYLMIYTS